MGSQGPNTSRHWNLNISDEENYSAETNQYLGCIFRCISSYLNSQPGLVKSSLVLSLQAQKNEYVSVGNLRENHQIFPPFCFVPICFLDCGYL